ncbi:RNA polymerase sigma factor [Lentibacillus sediminis]|uniref:RNA polymerase sigma factor n=1 Tax=Lentibacillus sediminis TaxID=1940529 RepID=UPI000C1C4C12|nr:sigma-70 family RNA polymerase sigma factor [Lentibacillus sediminis]
MRVKDVDLFQRVQSQDEDALEQLYDRYEKLLFSFSFKMTNNKFLAEEAVQDVFTKIWSKQRNFDEGKGKFSSWLLTVTRNTCIDLLRKKKDTPYELEERDSLNETEPTPEEELEWKERGEEVRMAVGELSQEQQEIIELFYFKGMSQSSIAEKQDIPLGTVKGRLRLSLKHLKGILKEKKERGVRDDV